MSSGAIALPGQETLIASWRALAVLSPGARLVHTPAATAAVFPSWAPLNNAILEVTTGEGADGAVGELGTLYADAGIDDWALWVPSCKTDLEAPDDIDRIGTFARDTTTLVMQARLRAGLQHQRGIVPTSIPSATRASDEPVPVAELEAPEPGAGLTGWAMLQGGVAVAGAWSILHEGDCGIYAVGTVPDWRRRGLARRLVEHIASDAHGKGARTATLQSTAMAEHLYRSLGFLPAGRYEEWLWARR